METMMTIILIWFLASIPVGIAFGAFLSLGSRTPENVSIIQMEIEQQAKARVRKSA